MKLSYPIAVGDANCKVQAFCDEFDSAFPFLAENGYEGVELLVRDPFTVNISAVEQRIHDHGLSLSAIGTSPMQSADRLFFLDAGKEKRQEAWRRCEKLMELIFSPYVEYFSALLSKPVVCPDGAMLDAVAGKEGKTAIICTFTETVETTKNMYYSYCRKYRKPEQQGRYETVLAGQARTWQEWSRKAGTQSHLYVVPDYYKEVHGRAIAHDFYELPFFTGGSGLIGALGAEYASRRIIEDFQKNKNTRAKGPAVLLAGSCSKVTLQQIEAYRELGRPLYQIDPIKLLQGEITGWEIWEWVQLHPRHR